MNKNLLRNSFALAMIIWVVSVIMGVLSALINVRALSMISPLIGAYIAGYIYSAAFKELMDKKLRLKVSLIYTAIGLVISAALVVALSSSFALPSSTYVVFAIVGIAVSALIFLLVYATLGFSCKKCMEYAKMRKPGKKR